LRRCSKTPPGQAQSASGIKPYPIAKAWWYDSDIDIESLGNDHMATQQVLVRLPEELARRFKRTVSPRHRSEFIRRLLEQALPANDGGENDPLYHAAVTVENDERLNAEMAEWETATINDGLTSARPDGKAR
jgi:hypothetical protein